jgi:hypothetical protein
LPEDAEEAAEEARKLSDIAWIPTALRAECLRLEHTALIIVGASFTRLENVIRKALEIGVSPKLKYDLMRNKCIHFHYSKDFENLLQSITEFLMTFLDEPLPFVIGTLSGVQVGVLGTTSSWAWMNSREGRSPPDGTNHLTIVCDVAEMLADACIHDQSVEKIRLAAGLWEEICNSPVAPDSLREVAIRELDRYHRMESAAAPKKEFSIDLESLEKSLDENDE